MSTKQVFEKFKTKIEESYLFNPYDKKVLLENADIFDDEYLQMLIYIIDNYQIQAKERINEYINKMEKLFIEYEANMNRIKGLDPIKKEAYIKKNRTMLDLLILNAKSLDIINKPLE